MSREIGSMTAVRMLPQSLQFVSDSQDVEAIKANIPAAKEYDSFFVGVQDGDYTEVWAMVGIVPYSSKLTTRVA